MSLFERLGVLFSAELGQTRDPRELVPGQPEQITEAAATLAGNATQMGEIGDGLRQVRTPGWSGTASDAFWDRFTAEPVRWQVGHDAMNAAADALTRHAEVLRWAQTRAQEAIDLWEQGDAATEQARSGYTAAAEQNAALGAPPPAFEDPGEPLRSQARQLLAYAREQVDISGSQTATVLDRHAGRGDDSPGWLANVATAAAQILDDDDDDDDDSPGEIEISDDGVKWVVIDAEGDRNLWEKTFESDERHIGPLELEGEAEVNVGGIYGSVEAAFGSDGLSGDVEGKAYLFDARAEGELEVGEVEATGSVEAFAGVEGKAGLAVGPEGVRAEAGGVVGVKAVAEGAVDLGDGTTASAHAGAVAGLAAEAGFNIGRNDDGGYGFGGHLALAAGLGFDIGWQITVNPRDVTETISEAADTVGDIASSAGDLVESGWDAATGWW